MLSQPDRQYRSFTLAYMNSTSQWQWNHSIDGAYNPPTVHYFDWDLQTDTWIHVAITRSSGNLRMFINGSQIGTTLSDPGAYYINPSVVFRIGSADTGGGGHGNHFYGHMDDIRMTHGLALYTANFSPPPRS